MNSKKRPHSPDEEDNLKYWRRRTEIKELNKKNCFEFIVNKFIEIYNITKNEEIQLLKTKVNNIFILYTQLNNHEIVFTNKSIIKLVNIIQEKLHYEKSFIYDFFNYETMYLYSIGYF